MVIITDAVYEAMREELFESLNNVAFVSKSSISETELLAIEKHDYVAWDIATDDDSIWDEHDIALGCRDRSEDCATVEEFQQMYRTWADRTLEERCILTASIARLRAGEYSDSDSE